MAEKIARRGVVVYIDGSEVKNSVAGISNEMRKLQREQKKMTIGADDYIAHGKKIGQLKALQKEHIEYQRKIAAQYDKSGNSVKGFFNKITGGFGKMVAGVAIGAALWRTFQNATQKVLEFSKSVSELKALTGASGKDLDFLKVKARELGAQYGKSATEIVTSMKLVGSAKPELLENVSALAEMTESVVILSKATGMSMEDTTNSLTTIMNQFGMSAVEGSRVINALAAGSKFGAVEVDYLGESISKVGVVMKSAGIELETGVAVMELFGEKGVKAETAGNGFKKVLVELQSDTKNYTDGVFDLNKAIDNNQSIAGDNIALQKKFGVEFFSLAQILFQNKERFMELNTQVRNTNTALEQYADATDNLSGDIDKMTSAWDRFVLSLEDGQGPIANAFRGVIQWAAQALNALTSLTKSKDQNESDAIDTNTKYRLDSYKKELNQIQVFDDKIKDKINETLTLAAKIKDINAEITAETGVANAKRDKALILAAQIKENEAWVESTKKYLKGTRAIEFERRQNLSQTEKDLEKKKALLKSYNDSIKRSNSYITTLGGLRDSMTIGSYPNPIIDTTTTTTTKNPKTPSGDSEKFDPDKFREENRRIAKELADASISDLEETLQFAEYVQREQLAGRKLTLEEEHALKLKSLETDRQLELDKAEISATSAEEAEKAKKLIRQKYQTLTAEENAAFTQKQADIDKKTQEKLLSDRLAVAAQDSEEAFELERQMREMQMAEELALVEKGSQEEKAIRDKYRKMEEDAEANLLYKKQQMMLEYANMGMNIANGLNSFLTELDNAELANFEANNKDKANFEEEYAKKKAEIQRKEAIRSKVLAAFDIAINTSSAIVEALPNIPLSIMAGVAGALQLATVLATPLPQLWTGGFTGSGGKYEPKGVVHGNEFVANSDALNNPNLLPMFQAIDTAQRMGTVGSMRPTDLRRALREESAESNNAVRRTSDGGSIKLEKSIDRLNRLLDDGIEARSVVSGRHGSYEQTKKYERYIKNASR